MVAHHPAKLMPALAWLPTSRPMRRRASSPRSLDPRGCKNNPRARGRTIRILNQTRRIGKPNQLGEMHRGARTFGAAEHPEVRLMSIEIREEYDAGLVRMRRSLENVARQRNSRLEELAILRQIPRVE